MDCLWDLERVILGEKVDRGLDLGVIQDLWRYLIEGAGSSPRGSYLRKNVSH